MVPEEGGAGSGAEAVDGSGEEPGDRTDPGGAGRPDEVAAFRLLFVCTGNTCRSPMAEAIARREIDDRGWRHVEVASAGVSAYPGSPASQEAVEVARERGLDLANHRSRPLSAEEVEAADVILVMAPHHLDAVRRLGGEEKGALLTLFAAGEEGDGAEGRGVPDPIGGTREEYAATFRRIEELVTGAVRRLETVVSP